jgi:hypothetical protein
VSPLARPTVLAFAVPCLAVALGCGAPSANPSARPRLPSDRPYLTSAAALSNRGALDDETDRGVHGRLSEAPAESEAVAETAWFFESLSSDGKRALLRELDPRSRATFHVRAVEVDGGRVLEDVTLPELAKIPAATIGSAPTELAALEWMLASQAFARDVVRGARVVGGFPFGEGGRLAAAANGSAIAFDAGDWLYVADETGHARRRLVDEAAYDPRFTPDGKSILFRRAVGTVDGFARYELEVVPADLSAAPRALPGSAGARDRFVMHPDGQSAVVVATQARRPAPIGGPEAKTPPIANDTCVLSLGLKAPFPIKKLACLEGGEQLVEFVVSPKGKWAAVSTKRRVEQPTVPLGDKAEKTPSARHLQWRLRVVSLAAEPGRGKVVRDEPDVPGLGIRAISDTGLLVQSGTLGAVVHDVPGKRWRELPSTVDLGHRGFFRNDKDLVYIRGGSVAVLDVAFPPQP